MNMTESNPLIPLIGMVLVMLFLVMADQGSGTKDDRGVKPGAGNITVTGKGADIQTPNPKDKQGRPGK